MTQMSFQRAFILITCFAWASRPLRPQVSSGGVVATSSAVVDFTNAGQTIPARKLASDPAACSLGEQYFNTTSNVLKVCTAANTWTNYAPGGGAGTSGGVPYFSGANSLASSAALSANGMVVGGGAGAPPKSTGVTVDASNNITTPGTLTTGSGGAAHGKLALGELPSNGSTTAGWEAPNLLTSSLSLVFPNANPAANSIMLFPAPTSGQSQWIWTAIPGCLDASGNHLNFNSATGAISCGTSSSAAPQGNITVANAAATGTTINTLTKLTGAPSTAVISSAGDSGGAIGITTAGAGTSGSATITNMGVAACVFDSATTAGDYVQISSTVAGNCHDTGAATYPSSGQIIGRVLSTNASAGSYNIDLFTPEIKAASGGGNLSVLVNGASIASQPAVNFVSGTGITQSCANNAGNGRVDCTPSLNTAVALTNANAQANKPWYCNSTNGTTTYTCTLSASAALTTYTTGQHFLLTVDTASTGAQPTLNIDGLGAKNITRDDGVTVPAAGAIGAGKPYVIYYDGSVFRILNGGSSSATSDLTSQSATITATALYTPTVTGMFRVTYYAKVTTAASTSSVLGGATGFVLGYTDGGDSVAQNLTLPETGQSGNSITIANGNTGNTTTTATYGTATVYAKAGVAITYAFGYTSVGGTAMVYELHIKLEQL